MLLHLILDVSHYVEKIPSIILFAPFYDFSRVVGCQRLKLDLNKAFLMASNCANLVYFLIFDNII